MQNTVHQSRSWLKRPNILETIYMKAWSLPIGWVRPYCCVVCVIHTLLWCSNFPSAVVKADRDEREALLFSPRIHNQLHIDFRWARHAGLLHSFVYTLPELIGFGVCVSISLQVVLQSRPKNCGITLMLTRGTRLLLVFKGLKRGKFKDSNV